LNSLDEATVEAAVQRLRQQSVDGIVVVSPQTAMARAFRKVSVEIPTVAIWGPPTKAIPTVTSSETAGARLATEHLLSLGHKNVTHLAGPADRMSTEERMRGWREVLMERG